MDPLSLFSLSSDYSNLLSSITRPKLDTVLQLLSKPVVLATIVIVISIFVSRSLLGSSEETGPSYGELASSFSEQALLLRDKLASALPDIVDVPRDSASSQRHNAHWAKQACEVLPTCTVAPRNVQQLSAAIKIIKQDFDKNGATDPQGLFSVRSGGHSHVSGAASIHGGVIIDMRHFADVTTSEDGSTAIIGVGATWMDVYSALEQKGLTVVGGRNGCVGVGGLVLGGGISFFSPQYGLACSNIVSYEIVLASGDITTASATTNPGLWRALKGGSNNFGVVTRITTRTIPCTKIWSGFVFLPSWQAQKAIACFHSYVNRTDSPSSGPNTAFDRANAGPLTGFTYLQNIGLEILAVNLASTTLPERRNAWPATWESSGFRQLWRYGSSFKTRSISDAAAELASHQPYGNRQAVAATTIRNHAATLDVALKVYRNGIAQIRKHSIKGACWSLVLQPFDQRWTRLGDPNVLGLDEPSGDGGDDAPLVSVSIWVYWKRASDDAFMYAAVREAVDTVNAFAQDHGAAHRYRFLNYADSCDKVFEGYGEKNWQFLKEVSRRYDPDGLFQKGCKGGFKLGMY